MKQTIHNQAEKDAFIHVIQETEVKQNYRAEWTQIRRKRSLSSNAYMWLLLTIGEQETGNTRMDLYAYFLSSYPTTKEIEIMDEICIVPITSSGFDSKQMSLFIDNVRREFAQMGIATPDAGSEKALDAYNYYQSKGLI